MVPKGTIPVIIYAAADMLSANPSSEQHVVVPKRTIPVFVDVATAESAKHVSD